MVGLGHTDDWGSGSTEEAYYSRLEEDDDGVATAAAAARGTAADWDGEWDDDDLEFLSSFGFAGDSGDGHGHGSSGGVIGGTSWGEGAAEGTVPRSLSARDAARLAEVGIMVRELEAGTAAGDGAASVTTAPMASGPGAGAGTGSTPAAPRQSSSREEDDGGGGGAVDEKHAADAERRADFAGGVAVGNARLRMTCGDPVFFGQLADLMQGLHRQSGGKKFLTHAEEMELGAKVQRYRQLIEVRYSYPCTSTAVVVPCVDRVGNPVLLECWR